MRCSLDYPSCQRCRLRGWTCQYESKTQPPETRKAAPILSDSPIAGNKFHASGTDVSNSTSALSAGSHQPEFDTLPSVSAGVNSPTVAFPYSGHVLQDFAHDFSEFPDGINAPSTFDETLGVYPDSINADPINAVFHDTPQVPALSAPDEDENSRSGFPSPQLANESLPFVGREEVDRVASEKFSNSKTPNGRQSALQFPPEVVEVPANYRHLMVYGSVTHELPLHPRAETLIEFIRNYPLQMLDIEYWPPFIHSKLYRCSDGGISEPLAVALCCFSARLNGFESSMQFLNNMIDNERARLLDSFVSYLPSSSRQGIRVHRIDW